MIVDDEPALLMCLLPFLEDDCHEIYTANNGQEALKIYHEHKLDCILSDINMPVMTGLELVQAVRKENATIPFIFFTAYENEANMKAALRYGAFDFIQKPMYENLKEIIFAAYNNVTEHQSVLDKFKNIL